jgi:valyl-tRNA synthetase
MAEIPSKYKPQAAEEKWAARWEEWRLHAYDPSRSRDETFVVDTPPPTVSGSLHVGHVFSYTHQDLLVRFQRMQGKNIHYGMGWDDNGLPTERRVQNVYGIQCDPTLHYEEGWRPEPKSQKDSSVTEVSRKNFIEACEILTAEDERTFEHLWRRLGLSIDWNETYATIDDHCRRVSQASFLDLVAKGHVYNTESPTMWDTDFKTAVAQAEVEDRERPGFMHDVRFAVKGGGELTIATTRPELLPACIAVVAHPDDERYQNLFGRTAITPLFGAEVPILAAEHADPEKGTGILMVCTFGDAMDVEWWKQSRLPLKPLLGRDGRLLPIVFGEAPFESVDAPRAQSFYDEIGGLFANQAKKKVTQLLTADGTGPHGEGAALTGDPRPISHAVKFYEKGERPLEFVTTRQWFVNILAHKDELLAQGDKIQWHPAFMKSRYTHWVEGLNQDWCVSRQRYFGVPFPVWYPLDANGEPHYQTPIFASADSLPVDPQSEAAPGYTENQRNAPGGFIGDPDVMDTWATSSMTPEIQSRWRIDPDRHQRLFPMDIRPQSHEIIRTWAFYTIVKALLHENQVPWHHVVISGWILDPDRKKMSKSKGNVVTPEGLLDEHSVDAVRYWAGRAKLGGDTAFDETVFKIGKRLTTKVFNASRFVFMQLDRTLGEGVVPELEAVSDPLDQALIARLRIVVTTATGAFARFEYSQALLHAEDAFWNFCDDYLELVKTRSYADDDTPGRRSAVATLHYAVKTFLRLLAPFLPYVTEEVWSWRMAGEGRDRSVHTTAWPTVDEMAAVPEPDGGAATFTSAVEVLSKIRGAKSTAQKSLKWPVATLAITAPADALAALAPVLEDVLRAGSVDAEAVTTSEGPAPDGDRFDVQVTLAEENPAAPA